MNSLRPILLPGVVAAGALATLLGLGTWQLGRKAEKEAVLAALERAITAEPIALDAAALNRLRPWPADRLSATPNALRELTRVTVAGEFIQARAVPVRATLPAARNSRELGGLGYFWMTPLRTQDGAIVFINRGFVPTSPGATVPAIETPQGAVSITGLLRVAEKPAAFTPPDRPDRGEYFSRDPAALAGAFGLSGVAEGLFIDAERSGDALTPPVGVDPRELIRRIPNNHLQYAVTWYGLALTLIGVFIPFARARLKAQPGSPA